MILVEHLIDQNTSKPEVEDIQKKQDKNPFKKFPKGQRLNYNTDALMQSLAKNTLGADLKETGHPKYDWRSTVNAWHQALVSKQGKHAAVAGLRGRILQYAGRTSEAVVEFK